MHLFLVHSHVTAHVAEAVVAREGIDPGEAVFLASRGFEPAPGPVRGVPVPWTFRPESFPTSWWPPASRRRLAALDRTVAGIAGGRPFRLGMPQTGQRFMQLLLSHPLCRGFSFLEEGLHSYRTPEEMDRIHPPRPPGPRDRLGYRGRLGLGRFFEDGSETAYGLHPAAFPGHPARVVLEGVLERLAPPPVEGVETVLVFDGLTRAAALDIDALCAALRDLLARLASEGTRRLHYKLHPAQAGTRDAERLRALLAGVGHALEAVELPAEVSPEALGRLRPAPRFLVNLSSVGLYAALQGCPVFSYAPWIARHAPAHRTEIEATPRIFRDLVPDFPA